MRHSPIISMLVLIATIFSLLLLPASTGSAQTQPLPAAPEAGCLSEGYPADGEAGTLTGDWVGVVFEYTATERGWNSYDVEAQGALDVEARSESGLRAFRCADLESALAESRRVAAEDRLTDFVGEVYWNGDLVVRSYAAAPEAGCIGPVNPADNELVVLNGQASYVVEQWGTGNRAFGAVTVDQPNSMQTVHALPQIGERAWICADLPTARSEARRARQSYMADNPGEVVELFGVPVYLPLISK